MQNSLKEKIEKRAYQLFLKRGGVHGYAMEDWAQAEKEVNDELNAVKKVAAKPSVIPVQKPAQKPVPKATDKKR
jgi:hypothetical protein